MPIPELVRRLQHLFNRDQASRDLEEEMRLHLEMRAMQVGEASARKRFGNTTSLQQQSRDAWGFTGIDNLLHDVRFATRRIWKQRTVSVTVIAVMGIGIGATTAMFSAVDAALLRPLPFEKPEQLMMVPIRVADETSPRESEINFKAISNMPELFSHVAAYGVGGLNMSDGTHAARLKVGVVTTDFFATLGASAAIGRVFLPEEGVPGGTRVVVLSDALWKSQFASKPIAGLRISLNNRTFDVVGVMPPAFTFPEQSDIWVPMTVPITTETFEAFRDFVRQTTIARVADNVTVNEARWQLFNKIVSAPGQRWPRHPEDNAPWIAEMRSQGGVGEALQTVLSSDRKVALYVLLGATGMLLLIACANVTNLLLAQASVRRREIALRQVLGATRGRIARQLLAESILLSLAGAVAGTVLAHTALQAIQTLMPTKLLGVSDVHLDLRVLVFSAALAVAAGLLFGMWPAMRSARHTAAESIKGGDGLGSTAARSGQLRRLLVGAELAFTVVLLIGAGILLRSFSVIVNRETGLQSANVGTMELAFPMSTRIPDRQRAIDAVVKRIAAAPGVDGVGASKTLPLATAGQLINSIVALGSTELKVPGSRDAVTMSEDATGGYFTALRIPLLEGRYFNEGEDLTESNSAIVSASVAKRYWSGQSAIGRQFHWNGDTANFTIVGVVADVPRRLDAEPWDQIYRPLGGNAPFIATIVARGSGSSVQILSLMQNAVREIDPTQPVFNLRTMTDVRDVSIAPRRSSTKFLSVFAILALTLASVGVYAVVSYGLAQRQRELGIRAALGATGRNLLALLSTEMAVVALIGVAVGVGVAWASARILSGLVYGVDVHDPVTFVVVPIALLLAAMIATLLPARRAFRVNPAEVMRAD